MDKPIKHIYPIGDIRPHYSSERCSCEPISYEEHGEITIRHRAFDGRPDQIPGSGPRRKMTGDDMVVGVEVLFGIRCEDCLNYINEKGEHIDSPPTYEETL